MEKFATAGEQFAKRKLETEKIAGATHYAPGQHSGEVLAEQNGTMMASLTFVNALGFLMAMPMVRPVDRSRPWEPMGVYRQIGLMTASGNRQLDNRFVVTKKMRECLEEAEERYREGVGEAT